MRLELEGVQEISEQPVTWIAEIEVSYRPAQLFGSPENSYPDESEADILALSTEPPGFEDQIDEDLVLEAAWEEFAKREWEGP